MQNSAMHWNSYFDEDDRQVELGKMPNSSACTRPFRQKHAPRICLPSYGISDPAQDCPRRSHTATSIAQSSDIHDLSLTH